MASPVVQIRNLSVTYSGLLHTVHAVKSFSADVYAGEALALVGESGSGKTTVAMALMGLLDANSATVSGSVELKGRELLTASPAEWQDVRGREIAMIFQDPMTSLNPYLSVGLQVAEPLVRHGLATTSAARDKATALLERMEVADAREAFKRHPHQYSGGMRQRAMIASSFAGEPTVLIADEPTTALDVITQARILRMMRRQLADRNMALVLITHDLGIVAGVCDRAIVMRDGEIVECADIRDLYRQPEHAYTKRLLAAVPRLDAESRGRTSVPSAGKPILAIRNASVRFSRRTGFWRKDTSEVVAVNDVSLDVSQGEVLGLVGQSGSGKTTLVRAVAGLQRLSSGSIEVDGVGVSATDRCGLRSLRRRVQMIFQDPQSSLNGRFTAERIIAEPLINFGVLGKREALRKAHNLMELVQLDPAWGSRYPHEFSGGQCQRIGIARALAVEPEMLLCDEPVSALDVSIQADVLELLCRLRSELKLTILFISHDLAVVRHIADRVAVMHQGRIVELKPAARIYTGAEHDYTKSLLQAVPIPDPEVYRL